MPSSVEQQQSEESTYFTESEAETSEVSETESIQDEITKIEEKAKQEVTNEAASSVNKMQSGGTVYLTESEILTNKSNKKPKSDI